MKTLEMNQLLVKKLILICAVAVCPVAFAACSSEPVEQSEASLEQQMQQVEAEERAHMEGMQQTGN